MQHIHAKYHDNIIEKAEHYMKSGMSSDSSMKKAKTVLRGKYQTAFENAYKDFLLTKYFMKKSPLHEFVWSSVMYYKKRGKTINMSITLALKDQKDKLWEVFDRNDDIEEEDTESEIDNTDDEKSDKEESETTDYQDQDMTDEEEGEDTEIENDENTSDEVARLQEKYKARQKLYKAQLDKMRRYY